MGEMVPVPATFHHSSATSNIFDNTDRKLSTGEYIALMLITPDSHNQMSVGRISSWIFGNQEKKDNNYVSRDCHWLQGEHKLKSRH